MVFGFICSFGATANPDYHQLLDQLVHKECCSRAVYQFYFRDLIDMKTRLSGNKVTLSFSVRLRCQKPWIQRTRWSRCVCQTFSISPVPISQEKFYIYIYIYILCRVFFWYTLSFPSKPILKHMYIYLIPPSFSCPSLAAFGIALNFLCPGVSELLWPPVRAAALASFQIAELVLLLL